jgi:hypothetical protein
VRRRAAWLGVVATACLVLSACGIGMPDTGPVHETRATGSDRDEGAASINPRRPGKGDSPVQIVKGFLNAMRATPAITTSIAREFLTTEASASWQPTGMMIYTTLLSPKGSNPVEATMTNVDRTDARGAWLGPMPDDETTLSFPMTIEDGEWRIAQPPPYLIVPLSYFSQRFQQVSLYFFDPSATMLVPEPVFVPRGQQFVSALVNGLLQGPADGLDGSEQSYLPPDLRPLVSVSVSSAGVARVDLTSNTGEVAMPSPEQAELLVSQLAWTLQQEDSITAFTVSIDGRPVQLPGASEFRVDHGHDYAPFVAGSSTQLFGLQDGRMVGGSPQNLETVSGPFGQGGYSLRAVAPDLHADRVAGVSESGTELWVAPVKDNGSDATPLIESGADLLRPAWDFSGRLWEIDRTGHGAAVSFLRKGRMHSIDVSGITGEDVKDFVISRDGTRLIAVVHDAAADADSIVVGRIQTTSDGQVVGALAATDVADPAIADRHIRDIAWLSPTSLAVLLPVTRSLFQVRSVSVDGAPGPDQLSIPIDDQVAALAGTPVPDETSYAFAPGEPDDPSALLIDLADSTGVPLVLDPRVTMLSYVG